MPGVPVAGAVKTKPYRPPLTDENKNVFTVSRHHCRRCQKDLTLEIRPSGRILWVCRPCARRTR